LTFPKRPCYFLSLTYTKALSRGNPPISQSVARPRESQRERQRRTATSMTKESPMPKAYVLRFSVLLTIALLVPAVVGAQSFNGSVSGTVKDPSGAIVAGAEMVLKNEAKGVEFKYKSTDRGEYAFRNLTPGSYELRANAGGFQPFVQKGIEVSLNGDV